MPKLSLSLLEKNPTLYAINLDEINGMDADFVARLQAEAQQLTVSITCWLSKLARL